MAQAGDGIAIIERSNAMPARWLSIVGIGESGCDGLSSAALRIIESAALVVGGRRHLALAGKVRGETLRMVETVPRYNSAYPRKGR